MPAFNNKKKLFGLFLILFFLLSFFNIGQTQAANKKVAVIGSSTFDRGCNTPTGFVKILAKELPNYNFVCKVGNEKLALQSKNSTFFLTQFQNYVSNKGYDELLLYADLNGLSNAVTLKRSQKNLATIIQSAKSQGMRVIVVGAQPAKGYGKVNDTWIKNIKSNNNFLATKPYNIDIFIEVYSVVDKNNDDFLDENLTTDKIHLNPDGNKILADLLLTQAYGTGSTSQIQIIQNTRPAGDSENGFRLLEPQTVITLPGLNFTPIDFVKKYSGIDESGQYLFFPYIGEYLSAIYKYGIVAGGVVAIVMIIIAGFQWTTSGGNATQTQKARTRITQAIAGLILLVGSYFILYTLNPNLVTFKNLKVLYIPIDSLERNVIVNNGTFKYTTPSTGIVGTGSAKKIENETFDDTFKAFANCVGADWRILKAFAYKESKLNHTIDNKRGFIGLFQTNSKNCRESLKKYPAWAALCGDMTNPAVNTAVGAKMLGLGMANIEKRCGDIPKRDAAALFYLNHNSGYYAVTWIIKNGNACKGEIFVKKSIIDFWNQHKNGIHKGKLMGEIRGPYAYATADLTLQLGVTDFHDTSGNNNFECPSTVALKILKIFLKQEL